MATIVEKLQSAGIECYNVDGKTPYCYRQNRNINESMREQGNYDFNPRLKSAGFWAGEQNGRFIICLDFDIYDPKTKSVNQELDEKRQALFEEVENKGCFKSSTSANYGMLCDITDCPSLSELFGERSKISLDCGLEVLISHNVVLPPTQTLDKSTDTMGQPRTFLSDDVVLQMLPDNPVYTFIKEVVPQYVEPKQKEVVDTEVVDTEVVDTEVVALTKWLEALPMKHWEHRADWFRIACVMKFEGGTMEEFVRLSRRAKGYEQEPLDTYQQVWDSIEEHKTTLATLCYWVKQNDEGLYERLSKETKHGHKVDFDKEYDDDDFVDEIIARYGDNFVQIQEHAQKKPLLYHFDEGRGIWTFQNTPQAVKKYLKQVCRDWEKLYRDNRPSVAMDDKDTSELNDKEKRLYIQYKERLAVGRAKTVEKTFGKSIATFKKYAGNNRSTTEVFTALQKTLPTHTTFAWNQDPDVINFKNCLLHIPTGQMRPRRWDDYTTETLDWDYKEADPTIKEEIMGIFRTIHRDPEQLDAFLLWMGYNITGHTSQQIIKFNLGRGSNGKSVLYEALEIVIPIYIHKMDSKTFSKDYPKAHKNTIQLLDHPIRIAYIEELDNSSLDTNKLKGFTAKQQTIERMYDINSRGKIQAKLNINSNYEPKIVNDGGILRRCRMQEYTSRFFFEDEDGYDKKDPNCFLKDKDLTDKFIDDRYKCAMLEILIEQAQKWYQGGLIMPEDWSSNFKEAVVAQDPWEEWFHQEFKSCPVDAGRVSKQVLLESAVGCPGLARVANWQTLRQWLKHKGLFHYERTYRHNGNKGVLLGIYRVETEDPFRDE